MIDYLPPGVLSITNDEIEATIKRANCTRLETSILDEMIDALARQLRTNDEYAMQLREAYTDAELNQISPTVEFCDSI